MFQAKKILLREKEKLQLDSDLYVHIEGEGFCQSGCVQLTSKRLGDVGIIRFHKKDIPRIVEALKGKIPKMDNDNDSEDFERFLRDLESGGD